MPTSTPPAWPRAHRTTLPQRPPTSTPPTRRHQQQVRPHPTDHPTSPLPPGSPPSTQSGTRHTEAQAPPTKAPRSQPSEPVQLNAVLPLQMCLPVGDHATVWHTNCEKAGGFCTAKVSHFERGVGCSSHNLLHNQWVFNTARDVDANELVGVVCPTANVRDSQPQRDLETICSTFVH